jgi:hypothetical protein
MRASSCKEYSGREADAFTVSDVDFLNGEGTSLRLEFRFTACGRLKTLQVDLE